MSRGIGLDDLAAWVLEGRDGIVPKASWGETSLFYNPGRRRPNGVYFCTIKEHDGPNDRASRLDRDGVLRLAMGIGKPAYEERFGPVPDRPPKGGVVETGHDFAALRTVTPHPVYGWMGWVQVLSPTTEDLPGLAPLVDLAYERAVQRLG